MRNAAFNDQLFLRLFGIGVVIVGRRCHYRGAVVNEVRHVVALDCVKHESGGINVVPGEQLSGLASDLGVQLHDTSGIRKRGVPVAGFGQVGKDGRYVRVERAENVQVVLMLVDRDNIYVTLGFQFDDEVLPHQSCRACQNHGRYTTARRLSSAFTIPRATLPDWAHSNPFLNSRVIGVSTKPGLIVSTVTPWPFSRWRRPLRKALTAALAAP